MSSGPPHGIGAPPWTSTPPAGSPVQARTPRRPGTRLIQAGVAVMLLGVVLGVALTALAFVPFLRDGQPVAIRGSHQVQAEAGDTFALYRLPGIDSALDCAVEGPNRRAVGLEPDLTGSTLTFNGVTYRTDAVFDTPHEGTYTVSCPGEGERFAVGPRISVLATVLLSLGGIFGGIALTALGVVLLVIGLILRASRRQPPQAYGPPPHPGSYPPGPYQGGPYQGVG